MKPNFLFFAPLLMTFALGCAKKRGETTVDNPPSPPSGPVSSDVAFWLTKGDASALLQKQNAAVNFSSASTSYPVISVDTTVRYQTMDGFGFALTGGSAQLINGQTPATRNALLRELFSTDSNAIGISYLRISIGASDLNASVFTYDDMPAGQTDATLQNFDLNVDKFQLVPLLKQILAINPGIKILASPWTAPGWMKADTIIDNNYRATMLNPAYFGVYADYFVKSLQAMKAEGIPVDAVTPQNEPLNAYNNPSMLMTASQQTAFIKNYLGPKFRAANLSTKIIVYDHNCDHPEYPLTVLSDAAANQYIDGSAFHLYAGFINALTPVHDAYPNKNVYFTEQYTSSTGSFNGDLAWHLRNLIIGAPRNWSRNVLEWNLANDPSFGPHTTGGCTDCKGALTLDGDNVTRNVSYYIIGHASKFVPNGSVRIASSVAADLPNVAYLTPAGKKVLIVLNDASASQTIAIGFKGTFATASLAAGSVATFVW